MIQTDLFDTFLDTIKSIINDIPKPKEHDSDNQKVLYYLIKRDYITFSQIYLATKMINLSARLSDLRLNHGLDIPCDEIKYTSKSGRRKDYGTWKLTNKQKGIEVYLKLVASKKQKTQ